MAFVINMYILHIETATRVCSVALSRQDELLAVEELDEGMNHTAMLAPMIRRILEKTGLAPSDLGGISVSSGPGSYTGLRVGSSTAKAMAYALNIPLLAVPTLSSLAVAALKAHPAADLALPMIDARRNEVYTVLTDRANREFWPVSSVILDTDFVDRILPDGVKIVICGDGAPKLERLRLLRPNLEVRSDIRCSARHLLGPAWKSFQKKEVAEPLHFVPSYLKPPNITTPKNMGL